MRTKIIYLSISACLLFNVVAGQSDAPEVQLSGENVDDVLRRAAEDNLAESENVVVDPDAFVYPYFFEIKDADGQVAARLNLTQGPFNMTWVKTKTNDKGQVVYVTNDKGQIAVMDYSLFNETVPTTSAVVTGSVENGTGVIDITITYTGMNGGSDYLVSGAVIKASIELGGPTRTDYWNITSASISVDYTANETASNITVDLTPAKFGYSPHAADAACTNGYGICAPKGLSWTCTDQVMRPNNVTLIGADKPTVFLHLPGMVLQPSLGNSSFKYGFSFNWDCDPIIPISLWASLLITIFLASILFWALYMISSLHTPNKFDDPKGPSIHVPQAE